ncbi:menaquinone-dependent protoporphyrinogen IX dehydrogenase [Vibrio aphrogenes]|uniref:menaquinone-dependent protoporphyrinogen IX dehydrogenase n=1 Tax=Vibrio aphrogenes TaxID=1891186 RepID=UPI000B3565B4|nr:menaquinone-dependent protoporphyrinogen IX dehydrogenase [Vibrio aphrogenes]
MHEKKYLILYSTQEGQTYKIAQYMAQELGESHCNLINLHEAHTVDFGLYHTLIIGASIRYGRFNKKLYRFIDRHLAQLNAADAYFYSVNLTARKEGKDTPEGSVYIQTFLKKSPWKPKKIGVFAGALLYPRYSWFDRMMIQLIMRMTKGETDTSKEVEYTNWEKVTQFTKSIEKSL